MNPFTFYTRPATRGECQSNVNHSYYELMAAVDRREAADLAGDKPAAIRASEDVQSWRAMYTSFQAEVRAFSQERTA